MHLRNFLAISCFGALLCAPAFAASTLSKSDKAFLDMAARTDMTEAHVGQMAEQQAAAPAVKDFARQLAQEHTQDYESLTELAAKVGEEIPKGIDIRRDRSVAALAHLKGKTFDRRFLQDEIRDHERVLSECKREAEHGENVDVKTYATKVASTLQEHLHKAEDLSKPAKHKS
ncbi:MAG: DUF4142 domain-containing protein [Bryobacteraceae bacterium]